MGPRILVLPGTAVAGAPDHALAFALAQRLAVTDATVTALNLADYPLVLLDICDEAAEPPEEAGQLAERIGGADALLLVSPEANGSLPSLPKNAIDWVSRVRRRNGRPVRPFAGLVVGLASASPGPSGAFPALTAWREVFIALGAEVIEAEARFDGRAAFGTGGHPMETEVADRLDAFAAEFAAKAQAIGRRP